MLEAALDGRWKEGMVKAGWKWEEGMNVEERTEEEMRKEGRR